MLELMLEGFNNFLHNSPKAILIQSVEIANSVQKIIDLIFPFITAIPSQQFV